MLIAVLETPLWEEGARIEMIKGKVSRNHTHTQKKVLKRKVRWCCCCCYYYSLFFKLDWFCKCKHHPSPLTQNPFAKGYIYHQESVIHPCTPLTRGIRWWWWWWWQDGKKDSTQDFPHLTSSHLFLGSYDSFLFFSWLQPHSHSNTNDF